jgi:hypothetical protein
MHRCAGTFSPPDFYGNTKPLTRGGVTFKSPQFGDASALKTEDFLAAIWPFLQGWRNCIFSAKPLTPAQRQAER